MKKKKYKINKYALKKKAWELLFAQKLRNAEAQVKNGELRDFSDFSKEIEEKFGF